MKRIFQPVLLVLFLFSFCLAPTASAAGMHTEAAVADFNGDGQPDLAAANNDVSVLLTPAPIFRPAASYAVGTLPYSVAVGDFNGDSKPDLVTANYSSNNVSVLLNDGDGTFDHSVTSYAAGSDTAGRGPYAVAVGDFNGDSKPDLVTANWGSDTVSVLLNDGDGTFDHSVTSYAAGSGAAGIDPASVAVGDFNGDGKPDLVVANNAGDMMYVRLNDGDGTFDTSIASYAVGRYPDAVAVGDFNGDGKPDLVVASGNSNTVSVRLNDGDGTFDNTSASYVVSNHPNSVATGDFNGDGKPDLVTTNHTGGSVRLLLNDGDGTFDTLATSYAVGTSPYSVVVGDYNQDGQPDLATANLDSNNVSVLLNDGNGAFGNSHTSYGVGTKPASVATADFNGDGQLDLVTANSSSNDVSVLLAGWWLSYLPAVSK